MQKKESSSSYPPHLVDHPVMSKLIRDFTSLSTYCGRASPRKNRERLVLEIEGKRGTLRKEASIIPQGDGRGDSASCPGCRNGWRTAASIARHASPSVPPKHWMLTERRWRFF